MGQLNLYYRAFKEYRKYTLSDKACIKQRQRIKQYASEQDKLETIRTVCIIDPKWVEQIEIGLPFVEKAIAEERQFIKNEGEVLDIEKVKHVSKDSVEHLARHSEFITHVPKEEGADIIPDKIYMVERLSDYAVYENRFLYMLLCYLRDFIDLRLKKIKELGNTYKANTYIRRDMLTSNGKIFFEGKLVEESKRDPYSTFDQKSSNLIERIESCQHFVVSLLAKPLMVMVAKSPMIKPPITKTNVLKMNVKFKNSVALYEYITAYQGPGYKIVENKKMFSPFTDEIIDDLAEIVNLTSFLTYEYGNDLNDMLAKEYEKEERERQAKERERKIEETLALKEKLKNGEIKVEEYLLSLERVLEELKRDNTRLRVCESDLNVLKEKHEDLKNERKELNKRLSDSQAEEQRLNLEITEMTARHERELINAEEKRVEDLAIQAKEMTEDFNAKSLDREKRYGEELSAVKKQAEAEYGKLKAEHDKVSKNRELLSAELHAVKGSKGLMEQEDFTTQESFEELEKELVAFYDMFVKKWQEAKKKMRNDVLWKRLKRVRKAVEDKQVD